MRAKLFRNNTIEKKIRALHEATRGRFSGQRREAFDALHCAAVSLSGGMWARSTKEIGRVLQTLRMALRFGKLGSAWLLVPWVHDCRAVSA